MRYTPILKAVESEIRRLKQMLDLLKQSTTEIFEPISTLQAPADGSGHKNNSPLKWRPSFENAQTAGEWAGRFQPWVASADPAAAKNGKDTSDDLRIEDESR